MKLTGTVDKLEDAGDAVTVTLTNVRAKPKRLFYDYGPGVAFRVFHHQAERSYPIGTRVELTIKPCPS